MKLEEMSIEDLTRMGKTHYLILSLLESAKTRIKNYPLEVSEDAALINSQALESIAKSIEERRGSLDRDVFLKEISSIFDKSVSEKEKKRLAKNKTISEAVKRKIEKRKAESGLEKS